MIHYSDFLGRDNRNSYAILRYILKRCCPSKNYEYKALDFMQLKWIIDRCNFLSGKWYGCTFLDYDLLDWINELPFIPETFDCDWQCDYLIGEYFKIVKDKKGNPKKIKGYNIEEDFLSQADIEIMDIVIFRWKLYGKLSVKISEWWYQTFKKK